MLGGYNRLARRGRLHCASAHVHLAIGILANDIATLGNTRRCVHARSCILAARREQTDQPSCGHCRPLLHLHAYWQHGENKQTSRAAVIADRCCICRLNVSEYACVLPRRAPQQSPSMRQGRRRGWSTLRVQVTRWLQATQLRLWLYHAKTNGMN
jgi:hypothetical protein